MLFDMQVGGQRVQSARRGEQERLSLHPRSRNRQAGASDQGDAGADRDDARRRAAVADAADSVHRRREADGAGVSPVSRIGHSARAAGEQTRSCRSSRRRGRTRSWRLATDGGANYSPIAYSPQTGLLYVNAVDQPAQRAAVRRKGYFSAYDPTTGELEWRKIFDGWGQGGSVVTAGGVVFVGSRQQHRRLFLRVRREDRRGALEVQHRRGRLRVAVDVHGERRGVRDRRVRRRRPGPPRRRPRSELRATPVVRTGSLMRERQSPPEARGNCAIGYRLRRYCAGRPNRSRNAASRASP